MSNEWEQIKEKCCFDKDNELIQVCFADEYISKLQADNEKLNKDLQFMQQDSVRISIKLNLLKLDNEKLKAFANLVITSCGHKASAYACGLLSHDYGKTEVLK
jgi:hypothetical protein